MKIRGELRADRRPCQFENGTILIPAWSLATNGTKAKMRFDGFEKIAHVTDWTDPAETASCNFVVNEPGRYQVSVTDCGDKNCAGSTAAIDINDQRVDFTSEDTGGWSGGNYRVKHCGTISMPKKGEQQSSIVPMVSGWKNIALKQILLTPDK